MTARNAQNHPICVAICCLLFVLVVSVHSRSAEDDYLDRGIKALESQQFKKALKFFELSTHRNPEDVDSWLNLAHALYKVNQSRPPKEPCKLGQNWRFQIIAALSHAAEIDTSKTLHRLNKDSGFIPGFKSSDIYLRWLKTLDLEEVVTSQEIQEFLLKNPRWYPVRTDQKSQVLVLKPNRRAELNPLQNNNEKSLLWKMDGRYLKLFDDDKFLATYQLVPRRRRFDSGKNFYLTIYLQATKKKSKINDLWTLGPQVLFCEQVNY